MKGHTPGAWKYFWNANDCYAIYPEGCDRHPRFPKTVIAEVCTRNLETREADARLIASAPEMRIALVNAVEALRATEVFMRGLDMKTDDLNKIIEAIDKLLDRIDG